jgi:hypothetical protein
MSYAITGLGQADLNTPAVRGTTVGNGLTDPWLDADLEVQNVSAADAPRIPREVRQALLDSGASVDSAAWDSRGKVHISWKPNATYNAVDYANIAKRIVAQATWARLGGSSFGRSARVIMPRYRINNRLSAAQYVYPTSDPIVASAPSIARLPLPEESSAPLPSVAPTISTSTSIARPWASRMIMGATALVSLGLVGAAVYMSRRKAVRKNRRRSRR